MAGRATTGAMQRTWRPNWEAARRHQAAEFWISPTSAFAIASR